MSENFENFQRKFRLSEFSIHQTKDWAWSVRPVHNTLGSGVLSLRRPAERFSEVNPDESGDLGKMVRIIETTLKKSFNYDRINYLMLMMVDFHVHFHVIPRYSHSIEFAGLTWVDKAWPTPPDLSAPQYDEGVLLQIKEKLKSDLQGVL